MYAKRKGTAALADTDAARKGSNIGKANVEARLFKKARRVFMIDSSCITRSHQRAILPFFSAPVFSTRTRQRIFQSLSLPQQSQPSLLPLQLRNLSVYSVFMTANIHTEFHRFLQRHDKERRLGQRGMVIWLCGLSGSGKSTIANAAERILHEQGRTTVILDGDNIRSGLNANLGFSDDDRLENIRRMAEVAKLFANQGIITFVSAITPRGALRDVARGILGEDFFEVYVKASFEACAQRDVKGLYAKAARGEIAHFTGKDSSFEEPMQAQLILDSENLSLDECVDALLEATLHQRSL
jgi:adenylylsulfate kinase